MLAKIKVSGIARTEECMKKIMEHIEEIRKLQREARFYGIDVEIDLEKEAASGN